MPRPGSPCSKDRRIVHIDQTPLRRKAASECNRLMSRIEKAREECTRFEGKDKPAFDRWLALAFGAVLTRSRELESRILEKDSLIQEIEEEMFLTGANPRTAYRRVVEGRKWQPFSGSAGGHPPPESGPDPADFAGEHDFTQEMMFEEMLRHIVGVNPDHLDDAAYTRMFREFKRKIFGHEQGEPPPFASRERHNPPPRREASRLKEIYRTLVRRLHPDLRADGNPAASSLWHEVQQAYAAGNLDRLETLLALTDVRSNRNGDHITLFQMRSVAAELERDLKALQKSLRKAKKDDAWNFSAVGASTVLKAKISRELNDTLSEQERRLGELTSLLDSWAEPPAMRQRKSAEAYRCQREFTF